MSLHLPARRVVRSANALASPITLPFVTPCIRRRTLFNWGKSKEKKDIEPRSKPINPLTEEFLRRKPSAERGAGGLLRGGLASSSIFEDKTQAGLESSPEKKEIIARNPDTMAAAVDPDPRGRRRWERKIVIREIRKRSRLTRAQALKRKERVILSKSHDFETSVKKLVPLAKQIAGKTVEEAIIQMRFSKKKVAKDVREHLEHAKNEAIVRRGMGLGLDGKEFTPVQIKTKDGKRVKVRDPTTLYVDQAWCGKGLFGRSPDYRARGNIHMMKNRTTSLSLVLKEEKTRIRLHEEREKKEQNRKAWVQLPNKPITAQRQYYSW